MKTDIQGCSTCPVGKEQWEAIRLPHNRRKKGVQYDYRHTDGVLFSTMAFNLALAREKRDQWLCVKNKQSPIESGYRANGYTFHHDQINEDACREFPCECGGTPRYIGLKYARPDGVKYIAISHCDNCGSEFEF